MANEISTISHAEIIARGGGPSAFARAISQDANRVKSWKRLSSIPAEYWNAVVDGGLASFRELSDAAEAKVLQRGAA